jgi:hypothetical protein
VTSSVGAIRTSPDAAAGDVQRRLRSRSRTCQPKEAKAMSDQDGRPLAALKTLLEVRRGWRRPL